MTTKKVATVPAPRNAILRDSSIILGYAIDAVESLLHIYTTFTKTRKKGGAPTIEEQDLLRAVVVFAGAGLDAALKQVVQSAMFEIVGKSHKAQSALATFVERRFVRADDGRALNAKEIVAL
jgi:hypothetical protein